MHSSSCNNKIGKFLMEEGKLSMNSDKRGGNGTCVKARKVMDLDRSGACTQGLGTTYLYLANTGEVGHGSEV